MSRIAILTDPDGRLSASLGVSGLPATAFISPAGEVVEVHAGAFTRAQLEAAIVSGLSDPATGQPVALLPPDANKVSAAFHEVATVPCYRDLQLRLRNAVLAFHSAPTGQGGTGAVLVLLARR